MPNLNPACRTQDTLATSFRTQPCWQNPRRGSGHWCPSSFFPILASQDPDLYPCPPETGICREIWAVVEAEVGAKRLPHFFLNLAANPSILWKDVGHSSSLSLENHIEPSMIV